MGEQENQFQKYSFDKTLDKTRSKTARVSYGLSPNISKIIFGDKKLRFNNLSKIKEILTGDGNDRLP
jgi:hypothetical protein